MQSKDSVRYDVIDFESSANVFIEESFFPSNLKPYLDACDNVSKRILELAKESEGKNGAVDILNGFRKKSYFYFSEMFGDLLENSLKISGVKEVMGDINHFVVENLPLLVKANIKLGAVTAKGQECLANGSLVLYLPIVSVDRSLEHFGITAQSHVDYHVLAGYLLEASNLKVLQNYIAIQSLMATKSI